MFEITKKIGITEYRDVINAVQVKYNYDLSNFSLTSLRRRIEKVYNMYNFNDIEDFINKLTTDEDFYETFLKEISVPTTEMFRDPSMWVELKDKLFNRGKIKGEYKIWIPEFTSDDELYSMLVILKETGFTGSKITASSNSKKNIEKITTGIVDLKKMEVNAANYTRQEGNFQLSKYFDMEEKRAIFDNVLLSEVNIVKHNLFVDEPIAHDFNIILFRNRFLYYNLQLQNKVLESLYDSLQIGGYLIIGINESLDGSPIQGKFNFLSKNENILKKIR